MKKNKIIFLLMLESTIHQNMKNLILLALFILLSCDGIEGQALKLEDTQALISEISKIDKCIDPGELKEASFDKEKLLGTWELENILDLNTCKFLSKDPQRPDLDISKVTFTSQNKFHFKTNNTANGIFKVINKIEIKILIDPPGISEVREFSLQKKFSEIFFHIKNSYFFLEDKMYLFNTNYRLKFTRI